MTSTPQRILLISNKVMHYRVPIYNFFAARFRDHGYELLVRADQMHAESTHQLDFDFAQVPLTFGACRREIERLQPQVVILFLHLKDTVIWPLVHWLKLRRLPAIFWTKGANLDRPRNPLSRLLFDYMHTVCDGLVLYSPHELTFVRSVNRHKVSVAPNTLNFDDFPEIDASPTVLKRQLGIPFDKVVLFAGRMDVGGGRKKVDQLIEVFRGIDTPGWGLVVVGAGMDARTRRRLNRRNTVYLGEIHDPEHRTISMLFRAADLFCIPGHVGLGLNQAFYWGLPVVTEAGGQPPEIHNLVHGRNGYLVAENDVGELGRRITYLLEHDDVRRELGHRARQDILRRASVAHMFEGFLERVRAVQKAAGGNVGAQRVNTRRVSI